MSDKEIADPEISQPKVLPVLANADGSPAFLLVGLFAVTVGGKTKLVQRVVSLNDFTSEEAAISFRQLQEEAVKLEQ